LLFATDAESRILMQRRPATGVWQGLWSLPEAQDLDAARQWFDTYLRGSFDIVEPLADIAHGFSHYRLLLQPLRWTGVAAATRVDDNAHMRWVEPAELSSLGIPAPIRTLIETQ
jgi:A/G-specific adenine glycosylase